MDLLRISTAGSVDDGKSTLIGRLLYDNNALTKEQEELIEKKTAEKGLADLDFSVITDGLIAEREQGITIDVAHIYFSTKNRKFIIADSPGHVEYTRNMVTGASNAETSIILIDARKGLLEQSHRHFYISQLLKLHSVVFCINKMDLVDYSEDTFLSIATDVKAMVDSYEDAPQISIVPISSLKGDNVVHKSSQTPWYQGETLNDMLHNIKSVAAVDANFRFDIQNVLHVQNDEFTDFRGYAGKVLSGTIAVGDEILALPSGKTSIVKEIRQYTDTLETAASGDAVVISLTDDIDVSRGVLFVKPEAKIEEKKALTATVVWLDEDKAVVGAKYHIQAGSRVQMAKLQAINFVTPPEKPKLTLEASELRLNDIGNIEIRLAQPIFVDAYKKNKANGVFILVDPKTNNTCAVGFVS